MATSGIPTYTSAPLNSNEEESTKATTAQPEPATSIEAATTAPPLPPNTSATATAPSFSSIPATAQPTAEPGAAPSLPVPTATTSGSANLTATPTSTLPTSSSSLSPPAPQPGAAPTPGAVNQEAVAHQSVPPPPKVGESVASSLPVTATATAGAAAPAPAPFTQSYAYQRPSQAHAVPNSSSFYSSVYQSPGPSSSQALPLHGNSHGGGGASSIFPDEDEPGLMTSAKSWMQSAGTKLAEVEAEVWKRINNAHDGK
ncbi:hypothetical protein N7492_001055 [Penicillium capsulatum]|uniref:Uncharacterized protein n=1 Tax=Penicillium capsulatum TaxID=69766 RepID=A0A9W9ISZ4_9EURO|nr:hypothetical protein N7492_001055 [Penicillium capsulatum]KAJ6129887.1 hypothetical protein N7512_002667 [Penicillium capsulatum]